jgi:hypothetical protein
VGVAVFLLIRFCKYGCTVRHIRLNLIRWNLCEICVELFTSTLDLELKKKLVKCYVWSIALYGAETWTLRAVDQKHLESFEMWYWRRMEKISWTDRVRNEVLLRVKQQRNILHEICKWKGNCIGHILRRNSLLQQFIEGKIKRGDRSDRKTAKKTYEATG